jgi:hypothetical protein
MKNSNFFIKKITFKNKIFAKKNNLSYSSNVHTSLKNIYSWDSDISFFLKINIFRTFKTKNRNRLKNIFCRVIHDSFFWQEIEKMIESNNVNICSDSIYLTSNSNSFSSLSRFLLNLYFSELDFFVNSSFLKLNNKVNILRKVSKSSEFSDSLNIANSFIPLKVEKSLCSKKNLNSINILLHNDIIRNFNNLALNSTIRIFSIKVFYTRFLQNFLFGVKSSVEFARLLELNFVNFAKGNLHLDISHINLYSSLDKEIYFLGYNLRKKLLSTKPNSFLLRKKYLNNFHQKISNYKKKLTMMFFDRFKLELSSYIITTLKVKNFIMSSQKESFFWTYLFQLESIRSSQFNQFLGSFDKVPLLTNNIFSSLKLNNNSNSAYFKYPLKVYTRKLNFLLKQIVDRTPKIIDSSISPLDKTLICLLKDFEKNIFISYQKLTKDYVAFHKSSDDFTIVKAGSFYGSQEGNVLVRLMHLFKAPRKANNYGLVILLPTKYCFERFRIMGFIHPFKSRPVGNPNYFSLEDSCIIKSFGYLSFCMITWFRCTANFIKVKLFVELMRQSCFLTLCRKHNKSKSWVYSVYSSDLVLTRSLFGKQSFFPSRKQVLLISRKFILSYSVFMDEKIFLMD